MRKLLTTGALLLALSCPAFAGEMHTGSPQPTGGEIPNPPAPQTQGSTDGVTLNGEMPTPPGEMATPGIMHTPGVSESLAQLGLDLLAVLPSIL